ncbi:MAG: (2Fe-2S) ferredoxin domain-containing protein [Deltaproteobacteria bacterium]|nr:(2Fe-2S) ferredoxin domain-containing protein [Deltaproteobacteria bacterium]
MSDDKKITSVEKLRELKSRVKREISLREDGYQACVTVHMGTCGIASGAPEVLDAVLDELEFSGRTDIRVTTSGCIGVCSREPVMTVELLDEKKVLYGDLDPDKARQVFRDHVLEGKVVPRYVVTLGDGA